MIEHQGRSGSGLAPWAEGVFALAFWGVGLAILALALGFLPASIDARRSPNWIVAVASVVFLAGGFVPKAARWGAFGAGARVFSASSAAGGAWVAHGPVSASIGRVVFGALAVCLDLYGIVIVSRWWRYT